MDIQKKKIELMAKFPKNKENEEQDLWRIAYFHGELLDSHI
jgi:hypothetical protein